MRRNVRRVLSGTIVLAAFLALVGCLGRSTAAPPAATPAASGGEAFTLALLPDTQYYSAKYPKYFEDECRWLATNAKARNLKYVVGLGDITDNNSEKQWGVAREKLKLLDGAVPLALVAGNHDYTGGGGCIDRNTLLNNYFSADAFRASATFGGLFDPASLTNSYHLFSAGGRDWLILCLEFGPRDEVVAWANGVLEKYPDRVAIVATHGYLDAEGQRLGHDPKNTNHNPHSYKVSKLPGGVNDGEELWQKLIRKHANVGLVVCGHVAGISRLTSTNDAGGSVYQMLSDYQGEKEGGQGYIRLLEFAADGKSVQVKTYSPTLDNYRTSDRNQFTLDLTKTGAKLK